MNTLPSKLQRLIHDGYTFSLGAYISAGFRMVQQNLGLFIGYTLVYMLISGAMNTIPLIGPLAGLFITPALAIGPYYVGHLMDKGQNAEFGDFFKGFSRLGDLVVAYLLQVLVFIGAMLPGLIMLGVTVGFAFLTDFESEGVPEGMNIGLAAVSVLLLLAPLTYLAVSYAWTLPLVWFYNLQAWQAMEASRKIIGRQWWLFLAFFVVCGLVAISGALLLLVGLLFTIPAVMMANYAAFADVTQLHEEGESSADIIDHFAPNA